MNVLVLETNELKHAFKLQPLPPPPHTQLATGDLEQDLFGDDCWPPKTAGSYHALVVTSKVRYIHKLHVYMLRPDSQPLAGFEIGQPASKPSSRFRSWPNEYTVRNFTLAIHRQELGNDSTHT